MPEPDIPKCELALFHWKQLGLARASMAWGVCQCCLHSASGDHGCSSMETSELIRNSAGYHMLCCAPQMPLWHFFVEGRGAGGMGLAAGTSIRSNYWLHHLGSFPAFWTSEVIQKSLEICVQCKIQKSEYFYLNFFSIWIAQYFSMECKLAVSG